jgi:precorrin-2 dehydrogenase/sirohydrochlorin ferrochelatase
VPNYYPLMLDVRERPALVVGGDAIAAEKAAALAASGAHVTALSPTFGEEMQALADEGKVTLRARAYQRGDLAGAFVVIAATTDDPALTEEIWAEARERGQLLNVVDVPARCSFIIPSVLRRGQLTIAVSTEGASPGLAKRIRQRLEALFPPAYGPYLRLAAAARSRLRASGVSYRRRDRFFGEFFDSEVLARLAEGDEPGAVAATETLLRTYGVEVPDAALAEEAYSHGHV